MDRAALDKAYNNTKALPDFPAVLAGFRARSAAFYESNKVLRDQSYGSEPRQRFDLVLSSKADAPTWIFIHGGYWQSLAKEDVAFVASGPLAHGFNVILVEYTLAPHTSMTGIVNEIGALLDHVAANREPLGLGSGPVSLAGHSAGGHLAAVHRSHPLVAHAMAISPLVDLEPISLCWLNENLKLTPDEVETYSPLRHIGAGAPMTIAVGAAELPELVRHSREYAAAAVKAGQAARYVSVEDANHFSVLNDLADPGGAILSAWLQQLAR
jgi:acetyl esterase/lipase